MKKDKKKTKMEQAEEAAKDKYDINTVVGYNKYCGFLEGVKWIIKTSTKK